MRWQTALSAVSLAGFSGFDAAPGVRSDGRGSFF